MTATTRMVPGACRQAGPRRPASAGPSGSGCHNGRHGHRHVVEHRPGRRPVAVELGSRRRPGDPLGVRARPRGARHRHAQGTLRAVHRRQGRGGVRRRHLRHDRPGHRADARPRRPRDPGRCRQGGPRRASRADALVGHAVGQGACQVPVPDRAHPPGAKPRVRGPRVDGFGQADQGEPRRRRAARGGPFLVLRGLGRQARVRVPRAGRPAARRGRPDHPVELPAAHAVVEDRAGAGRREHRRPQAGLDDAAVRPALRRRLPPGRPAAGRRQHPDRAGRGRDVAGHPSGRRQGRLHRLDRDRQAHRPRRRGHGQGADPRARWQGRQHRVRRRAARPGGRGHRQRHLLQPGRGVLRGVAPARPGIDRRAAHRQAQGPPVDDPRRRPARQEHRCRGDQLEGPAREDHRARGVRRGRGRRPLPARLRPARIGAISSARRCSPTSPRATGSRARRSSGRCSRS